MGIMDFIKSGVQEMMLARPDDKKNLIVWKHPENTIPAYAQLTVAADEAAVFFRDGANVGTLRTAGVGARHTLTTQNIPFLSRFVDSFTGGNIFKTDLFFVTTRPMRENFGDSLGMIEDPSLGIAATPRVFGQFEFQINNPELFIVRYTGVRRTDSNEEVLRWIKGFLVNGVRQTVGRVLEDFARESDPPSRGLLNLLSMQQELAQRFVTESKSLDDIGVQIIQVGNFNINLAEEEYEELKTAQSELGKAKRAIRVKQAEARARQFELDQDYMNTQRYVQNVAGGSFGNFAAGKAMMGAGEGMAKGGGGEGGSPAMMGAGFGVGVGMANAFSSAIGQGQGGGQAGGQAGGGGAASGGVTPPAASVTCGQCGKTVPGGKFCAECGGGLAPKPRFCPSCGTPGTGTARFCANCGTAFPQVG